MSNKTYDKVKYVVLVFLPSLITLIGGLGILFNYENTDILVTALGLFTTFLGSIVKISSVNYNNKEEL